MKYLFLDESGNHRLTAIDPDYPVFVLGGVIIDGEQRLNEIGEAVLRAKRELFGRVDIVLHTADLCRNRNGFEPLRDESRRALVRSRLNALLDELDFSVVACVIRKDAHLARHGTNALDPYILSLGILIERFCFDIGSGAEGGTVIAEQRGSLLDRQIQNAWEFLKCTGTRYVRPSIIAKRILSFGFASKTDMLAGLELADLVVTPTGRASLGKTSYIDYAVIESKMRRDDKGRVEGVGLVVLPKASGRIPLRSPRPRDRV